MEVIKKSREMNVKELAALVMNPSAQSIKKSGVEVITVDCWVRYSDIDNNGELRDLLAIKDVDGNVYATNSSVFIRDFIRYVELYEQNSEKVDCVKVLRRASKAGREFISCVCE